MDDDWDYQVEMERSEKLRIERFLNSYLVNPHPRELFKMIETARDNALRGLLFGGNLYWWPEQYGTHHDATLWMEMSRAELIYVELAIERDECGNPISNDVVGLAKPPYQSKYDYPEALEMLLEHPSLKEYWTSDGCLRKP